MVTYIKLENELNKYGYKVKTENLINIDLTQCIEVRHDIFLDRKDRIIFEGKSYQLEAQYYIVEQDVKIIVASDDSLSQTRYC